MKTIRVEIKGSERELKVVWSDESRFPSYFINRKLVDDCAHDIRRVLRELVNTALEGKLDSCGPILKRLADQGAHLKDALFAKTGGEGDPKRIRSYFDEFRDHSKLRFVVSDDVFVPWGLIYSADPRQLPDVLPLDTDNAWETYGAFWNLSHQISTVYHRIPPDAAGGKLNASPLEMIRLVHPETLAAATECLSGSPEESFIDWLNEFSGEPLTTSNELSEEWRKKGSKTGLLYFYCHASASLLALGKEEKIKASRLFLMLTDVERELGSSGCLVLLNGCSTATGSESGEFVQATARNGLCGFVGTEADVPDIFALRFSISLLRLLFRQGLPLGEAMQLLYRAHFPLSLLYGLYALPNFKMKKEQAPDIVSQQPKNFSFSQVGTNRLKVGHGS
ncbi:MAG TPA: hypothetical protein VMT72_14885 [Pseudolabrys sp.]|nr:hypothetical protein [Pseudolabrys sp.]